MEDTDYSIVVALDFSPIGDRALREAMGMAEQRTGAVVHVVHVIDEVDIMNAEGDTLMERQNDALELLPKVLSEHLRQLRAATPTEGDTEYMVHVRTGKAAKAITQIAADYDADLIVIGTHGRKGLERLILGSVAEAVVRNARCPVTVIKPKDHSAVRKSDRPEAPRPGQSNDNSERVQTHVYTSSQLMNWSTRDTSVLGPTF